MGCPSCGRGFHSECDKGCDICHESVDRLVNTITGNSRGAPTKDPEKVTDVLSTGRKRAAQLYPIFKGDPCEWQGKKNCGGGLPITGCISGLQKDRHHGPVKLPLRNEQGNVHRICKPCHNRWHARNDPVYNQAEYEKLPHKPEEASELDLLAGDAEWKIRR